MRIQIVALSIMFIFVFLLAPFPESDSLQNIFHLDSRDSYILAFQSVEALVQSTSSVDSQEDTGFADEFMISTRISDVEPDLDGVTHIGSRIIRETGLDKYQMEKLSEDTRETQVSSSDQLSFSPKSSFYATSINGNTVSTRYGFGFKDYIQNQHPLMQRNSIKQPLHRQHAPSSPQDNLNMPGIGRSNSLGEARIQQQIDNRTLSGIGRMPRMFQQHEPAPPVRPERRTARSLTDNR